MIFRGTAILMVAVLIVDQITFTQYAGDVSQCRSCNYIAGSDEFGDD